jgi:hypothetical protein
MNILRLFKVLSTQSIIMLLTLMLGFSTSTHAGEIKYTSASDTGKSSCADTYPANDTFGVAEGSLKGGCWSCPKGYKRNKLKSPTNEKACKKPKFRRKAKKSTVDVKFGACKGKDVWKRKDACWTCPSGYKRTMKLKDDGTPICKPKVNNKYIYKTAKRRGDAIGSCPSGFIRNPLKKAGDEKACTGVKNLKADSKSQLKTELGNILEDRLDEARNDGLIDLIDDFKKNLDPVIDRKGIKNVTKSDLRRAGAIDIIERGCGLNYGSFTITVGGDGSAVLGANADGGIAFGRVAGCETGSSSSTDWNMTWVATTNVSVGPSAGLDGSINVGFWRPRFDDLHGYAWGLVGGGAIGVVGVTASGWMGIDWKPGRTGEFLGVSVGYQGGASLEGELNWGYTFQKQTFNSCKNVTVHAVNKTGVDIKVIDVDYHDYYKKVWRSEPTPNRQISANGKPYLWDFNLNQVDHTYTQIRVKYRKKVMAVGLEKYIKTGLARRFVQKGKNIGSN